MVLGYGFITIPFTLFVADHTRAAAFVFAKEVIDVDDVLDWPQWVDRLAAQLTLLPPFEVFDDLLNPFRLCQVVQ